MAYAERGLLHKNKLNAFKEWLITKGYEIQNTKGIYEVLRAKKDKNTVIIFVKDRAKAHLTVQDKDRRLVWEFIKERKGSDTE